MVALQPEFSKGVKTFFVVPDTSIIPEDFLEDFFMNGFETYFIEEDQNCRLSWKIETILEEFEQVILFFNVDKKVPGIDWPTFIKGIQEKYHDRVTIGVVYLKQNAEKSRLLERLFLYNIGIFGGCVQLEYQKSTNLQILNTVLMVNQANGMRKTLRAVCGSTCKLDLSYKSRNYSGIIRDVSISHFSCVFPAKDPNFPSSIKIDDILLNLHGIHCKVSAVMSLNRVMNGDMIYVFAFLDSDGKIGLDASLREKVNKFVYARITNSINEYLQQRFAIVAAERRHDLYGQVIA